MVLAALQLLKREVLLSLILYHERLYCTVLTAHRPKHVLLPSLFYSCNLFPNSECQSSRVCFCSDSELLQHAAITFLIIRRLIVKTLLDRSKNTPKKNTKGKKISKRNECVLRTTFCRKERLLSALGFYDHTDFLIITLLRHLMLILQ